VISSLRFKGLQGFLKSPQETIFFSSGEPNSVDTAKDSSHVARVTAIQAIVDIHLIALISQVIREVLCFGHEKSCFAQINDHERLPLFLIGKNKPPSQRRLLGVE